MNLIKDSSIEDIVTQTMHKLKNRLERIGACNNDLDFTLKDIRGIEKIIIDRKEACNIIINPMLQKQIDLSYLGIMTMGLLSLAINEDIPIPPKWLSQSKNPNPNIVLKNLLSQITNNSLAIIRLVNDGLEYPARIVFRSNCELVWLTLIVSSNKEKMLLYTKSTSSSKQDTAWKELLKPSKLKELISDIETKFGFDNELMNDMIETRKHIYKFNSGVSHNAYIQSMIGAYAPMQYENENLYSTLFGNVSNGCLDLIHNLNDLIFYFIGMLFFAIHKQHKFKVEPGNYIWTQTITLKESFINTYIYLKMLQENLNIYDIESENETLLESSMKKYGPSKK